MMMNNEKGNKFKKDLTRRRRCEDCGQLKPKENVTYTINPYEQDVKGITIFQKLCDECYENLLSDI